MGPIIDVHAHVFNATDIPLEGYFRSRRSDSRFVDQVLSFFGPLLYPYLADRMRERCITRMLNQKEMGFLYGATLRLAAVLQREQCRQWEETLSKSVELIARELVDTYPDVDLFVPLMIDYEYWFKNTQDNPIKEQIDLVHEEVVRRHQGRIHPFVPFDPARELAFRKKRHNPDGELERDGSMKWVRDAIENKGFIGVKLYNALGYKPFNNKTVDLERRRVAIRNEKMPYVFEGPDYDAVLSELYDYCVTEEVPITAHCLMGGIESYPGASFDFAAADFWRDVLDRKEYAKLRLNLAHFGWNQSAKQGYGGKGSWVKDICRMMSEYEHVYADVSHHRVVVSRHRERFMRGYAAMRRDFANSIGDIKKKLLFGSDWHVLKRLKRYEDFRREYVGVLRHGGFFNDDEIDGFLGGNALRFLGLLPGGRNRERLATFYRSHGFEEPGWFKNTKGAGRAALDKWGVTQAEETR